MWRTLTETSADDGHVLFGLVNEPEYNFDGALNAEAWQAMNDTVQAIREVEDALGAQHHIVVVQELGGWSRDLSYYTTRPITAGGGENVAYEVHVYDARDRFGLLFENPSVVLPVIIGEYGPAAGMTLTDTELLQDKAMELGIPHLAWTFHGRCPASAES